jgi:hypothetical protein
MLNDLFSDACWHTETGAGNKYLLKCVRLVQNRITCIQQLQDLK